MINGANVETNSAKSTLGGDRTQPQISGAFFIPNRI